MITLEFTFYFAVNYNFSENFSFVFLQNEPSLEACISMHVYTDISYYLFMCTHIYAYYLHMYSQLNNNFGSLGN